VRIEDDTPKHAVTPGPTIPAHELLGELLLAHRQADGALAAYEASLERYPRRFNSLLGAARAARSLGRDATARAHYEALVATATGGGRREALAEAGAYLARR
jgi:hypothetical protein